ncbi:hypothetical protein F5876DRAFT_80274 [Lentinula aff. lateritia]|uniref:Uncharacterized protein n=1 Tax=Lentinula aff. lateritia TaxID=2804960 RepID=A0ACC1TQK1_9AGAR|nr:hypothetical protein F5876DRAFT_80274 [Lentinula aff. lateritia]
MHLINFRVYYLVLCVGVVFTVGYAMPFQPDSSSTPHLQVAQHYGAAISYAPPTGLVLSSSIDANEHGIIETPKVFDRLRKAVESLVPSQDRNQVVLAFKNCFKASAREDDVFKVALFGIGKCLNGCWFKVDKKGKIVAGSMEKAIMRLEFNTLFLIVVCLASTAYTLPFETSTAPTPPIPRAVSLTPSQPPTDPTTGTATGTITFLGTHSGVPLLPHETPKISTAYEQGHIPRDVYTRVRNAVREVVPGWGGDGGGGGGGGVLAFSNLFEGNEGVLGGGAGARGRVVQYGVIEEWEGGAGFAGVEKFSLVG